MKVGLKLYKHVFVMKNMSDDYPGNATITKHNFLETPKKERRGASNVKTDASYETIDTQRKRNCNRGTALEWSVGNYWVLNLVLSARNLTLNSDAHINYKYMLGPHRAKTYSVYLSLL